MKWINHYANTPDRLLKHSYGATTYGATKYGAVTYGATTYGATTP